MGWRKSSHSNDQGGSSPEVLDDHPIGVPVRDSKIPEGPALVFRPAGWDFAVRHRGRGRKPLRLTAPHRDSFRPRLPRAGLPFVCTAPRAGNASSTRRCSTSGKPL
ncbi:hypothetical protein SALBM217S_08240 [Streptomyces griseoloalbus]